jgi:hypothetical protein
MDGQADDGRSKLERFLVHASHELDETDIEQMSDRHRGLVLAMREAAEVIGEMRAALRDLRVISAAQDDLLEAYRLNSLRAPERALGKVKYRGEVLRRVDAALAKLEGGRSDGDDVQPG